jgi:hypothetical protein
MSTKARLPNQEKLPGKERHFDPQLIGVPGHERKNDTSKRIIPLLRNLLRGRVSQKSLVIWFLPLGVVFFFGTLMLGIQTFPGGYSWKKEAVSHIVSPLYNPIGFWIPCLGFLATAFLLLPMAGYVERCLVPVYRGLGRTFYFAFLVGLLLLSTLVIPVPRSLWHLHIKLASTSTASFTIAAICCCLCSFHKRFRNLQQRWSFPYKLAFLWRFIPLAPLVLGGASGIMLAGRKAGYPWALAAGDALRPTAFWQLAFWEWVGLVIFFAFFFLFVLSVPDSETATLFKSIPKIKPLPLAENRSSNRSAMETERM